MKNKEGRKCIFKSGLFLTVLVIMLVASLASAGLFVYFYSTDYGVRPEITAKAQNVILLIGDGMGKNHIEAASAFFTPEMYDMPENGSVETRSLNLFPTDSAAAATAMATGKKVRNGRISYYNGKNLENLGQLVKSQGKKLGVISTKNVTDATPAAFTAHTKSRKNQQEIALEQIRNTDCDVLFGLGREFFDPYRSEIETGERGYYNTYQQLMAGAKEKAYAIFDDPIPVTGTLTLASLTSAALSMLENDNGFFLVVEGGKIDSYSHANDMEGMLNEFRGFNDAIRVALSYASINTNTTVIVTADHETGRLNLPKDLTADNLNDDCFTRGGHSARDVAYFAKGPGAAEIPEKIDNTDIFFIIKQLLFN